LGGLILLDSPCISARTFIVTSSRCDNWISSIDSNDIFASVNTINTFALSFVDDTGGGSCSVSDGIEFSGNIGALFGDFHEFVLGDDSLDFEVVDCSLVRGNLRVPVGNGRCGCFTALVIKLALDENLVAYFDIIDSVVNLIIDLISEFSNESCPVGNELSAESFSLFNSTLFTKVANAEEVIEAFSGFIPDHNSIIFKESSACDSCDKFTG